MADQPEVSRAEQAAQRVMEEGGGVARARAILAAERFAVLATTSVRRSGHPFASLAPYALGARGEPILLLSGLAQHTRNLDADPRACLFVADSASASDPPSGARLAVLGRVVRVPPEDEQDARARYTARHRGADALLSMGDFALYVLEVEEAQLVGGFGQAGWIAGADLVGP